MPKDDEKSLRQLSLLSFLLGSGHPVTASDVQESVEGYGTMTDEAFRKRFHDDRRELTQLGFRITKVSDPFHSDAEAYYLPQESYRLPHLELTARELRALTAALVSLQGGFPYEHPLRLALNTLRLAQGGEQEPASNLNARGIKIGTRLSAELKARLARLDDAIGRRKSVEFDYRPAAESRPAPRRVDPYGLFVIDGHWYVVGRDHERQAQRMYRLDRITGRVSFLSKKPADFEVPADYDPTEYTARPPWLLGRATETADLWVDRRFAWWVERAYGRFTTRVAEGDDAILYSFAYSDPEPLLAWVMRHRSVARLQGPETLRTQLRRALEAIIKQHTEAGAS